MVLVVKAFLEMPNGSVEVRRVPFNTEKSETFDILKEKIASAFPALTDRAFNMAWKDEDDDFIVMSSDEELQGALETLTDRVLKVYIIVQEDVETAGGQTPLEEKETGEQQQESDITREGSRPVMAFNIHHPFGHRVGSRGALRGGRMVGRGCRMAGPGCRMAGPGVHPCKPRHPEMARANCPFVPMRGPGASRLLGKTPRGFPFRLIQGSDMPECPRKAGDRMREMRGLCGDGPDMNAWRAGLREKVPVLHRRWAKAYIQQWREQNLENASSTSSDEGTDKKISMEEANVPTSYARWLDMILPRIHKRWSGEASEAFKEDHKEQLKDDVPEDFRKWCRMYLNRRFAPRLTPESMPGPRNVRRMQCGKLFGAHKEQMGDSVPKEHRIFTKSFIKEWHREHALEKGRLSEDSSESDDQELQTLAGDIDIPADYSRWLKIVLSLLYDRCGVSMKEPVPSRQELNNQLEQFKDTVPFRYRKWVNAYVHKILSSGKAAPETEGNSFRKTPPFMRIQVFQMGKPRTSGTSESEATKKASPQSKPHTESQPKVSASTQDFKEQNVGEIGQSSQEQSSGGSGDEEIPPQVVAWMWRSMTREQLRRVNSEIKEQKRDSRRGMREARESANATQKPFQFRYV